MSNNVPEESLMPNHRRQLEIEFHQWAKNTGSRADVFNAIGWLQERGLMFSDRKREVLTEVRDDLKRYGWMDTAAKLDEVLKEE